MKKRKNSAKEIAKLTGIKENTINCFSVRSRKIGLKSIMTQRLLVYRILANCDLETIAPYQDDSNFKEKGIYAVVKLPNIKALNSLDGDKKDKCQLD